ncbi:hypothetical protein Tco_0642895 [Tanacetum coccineum]
MKRKLRKHIELSKNVLKCHIQVKLKPMLQRQDFPRFNETKLTLVMLEDLWFSMEWIEMLGFSVDDSEVTLNGCLGKQFIGGYLFQRSFVLNAWFSTGFSSASKQASGKNVSNRYGSVEIVTNARPEVLRLYASKVTAVHMRWHDEHVQEDGVMSHPSDDEAWKYFDQTCPPFAEETRNVRLGLCTYGFQPFGQLGKQYSCWPVIVTPYNLPPWMCMKDPYMFLTIIIPGLKNPKQRIDVFLQPLIKELTTLWKGSTYGKKACPYCMENSKAFSLSNGGKVSWFDYHRQFLPEDHPFRRNKNDFIKNKAELSQSSLTLTGEQVIEKIDEFELKEVT